MPAFDNLIHLKLVINSYFWEVLPELLHRTPDLECLEIDDGFYPIRSRMEAYMNEVPGKLR